jgi:uncharacterized membrane protein
MSRRRTVGLAIVFLWFFVGGIAHFAATEVALLAVIAWSTFLPRRHSLNMA